jgi:hypothetical protein
MHSPSLQPPAVQQRRGSAMITVIFLTAMLAILTTSILRYSISERRGNERNRVQLRAKNMAENISVYAAEQLTTKLYRSRSTAAMAFVGGSNQIHLPDASGNASVLSNVRFADTSGMEVRAGMEGATPYELVTDATDPNYGLQVSTATVPIIAKATINHPSIGAQTAHVLQEMQIAMTPLFQFGLFYNMDLELFPGQDMSIMGPVHTNGKLMARGEVGGSADLTFTDRVSAYRGLYADGQMKVAYRNRAGGNTSGAGGTGAVNYARTNGSLVNLYSGSIWRDHKYGQSSESTTTINNFKTFTTTTYGSNVRTNAHQIPSLELPGIGSYKEADDPNTTGDDRNNGRQLIEPPNPTKYSSGAWVATTDDADSKASKISWQAGLYIAVNPDDSARSATLPDGSSATILPHSYRAWLNAANSAGTRICTEVVLPGQPTYGYNNNATPLDLTDDYMYPNTLPNRYTTQTSTGSNQLLRIPQTAFTRGKNYLVNQSGGYAIGATTIAVDTGTDPIVAGDVVTIGTGSTAYRYLVVGGLSSGSITLAAPGLRVAVADNAAVTLNAINQVGTGGAYLINNGAGYAIGATTLNVDGATGSIFPGNTVTVGAYKYLVSAAPVTPPANATTTITIGIASPGLRVAATDNASVALDTTNSCTLGTAVGYLTNNASGYTAGAPTIALDSGTGTLVPGNFLTVGTLTNRVMVSSVATAGVTSAAVALASGLSADVGDNALTIVDPLPWTGYSHVASSVPTFPTESSTAPYPGADAYFFDLRRADGNQGYPSNVAGGTARSGTNYEPRAIAKIDFDMGRFKMLVARSVYQLTAATGCYKLQPPDSANWSNSIYNSAGTTASLDLGLDDPSVSGLTYTVLPPGSGGSLSERTRPDPFRIYYAPSDPYDTALYDDPRDSVVLPPALYDGSAPDAWFDGLAVYINSVGAEIRAQTSGVPNRVDSAVRLWNGRGNVATLTTLGKTGFTLCTNDAVYIVGHFNANGTVNTTQSSSGNGGYSARYPDNADEKLCAVMGDAVTLLSQPVFTSSTTPHSQTNGWNDALSAFRITNSSWSSSWRSSAPSSSNSYEGLGTSATAIRPGAMPTSSIPGSGGSTWQTKLPPVDTEYSTALLVGIVPSNHAASSLTDGPPNSSANGHYSGGAHNFPRLIEDWHCDMGSGNNAKLVIRGSMVALFESRVAMEPWNLRCYAAPDRFWGLHEGFRTADHDVPLEPVLISSSRRRYMEITADEYADKKTYIENLGL